MYDAERSRMHTLECLRLQADCMQLAGDALDHNVQSHFIRMAKYWACLAVSGPGGIGNSEVFALEERTA